MRCKFIEVFHRLLKNPTCPDSRSGIGEGQRGCKVEGGCDGDKESRKEIREQGM